MAAGKIHQSLLVLSGLLLCLSLVNAGDIDLPKCKDSTLFKTPMKNFNFDRYAGRWYGQIKIISRFLVERCYQQNLTRENEGYKILEAFAVPYLDGHPPPNSLDLKAAQTLARPSDNSGDGRISVNVDINGLNTTRNDYILDTDYKNFSIVYSCADLRGSFIEHYWIMHRDPLWKDDPVQVNKLVDRLESMGFNLLDIKFTMQDCGVIGIWGNKIV